MRRRVHQAGLAAIGFWASWFVMSAAPVHAEQRIIPAGDSVLVGETVAAFAPDFGAVVGLDPKTGARRWRVKLSSPVGAQELRELAGNLLVLAGDTATLIAPTDGRVIATRKVGMFATVGARGCAFQTAGTGARVACGVRCSCRFTALSCATLKPLAETSKLSRIEVRRFDGGGYTTECPGVPGETLTGGETQIYALATAPEGKGKDAFFPKLQHTAWQAGKQPTRWTTDKLSAVRASATYSGSQAGHCWLGGHDGSLVVVDCSSGDVLWRTKLKVSGRGSAQVEPTARGLIVGDGDMVKLLRFADGRAAWAIHAPDAYVLADSTVAWHGALSGSRALRLVSLEDGKTVAVFPAGEAADVYITADDVVVTSKSSVRRYDRAGAKLAAFDFEDGRRVQRTHLGESAIALRTAFHMVLLHRQSLLPLREESGSFTLVGLDGGLGRGRVALMKHAERAFDRADPETYSELLLGTVRAQ